MPIGAWNVEWLSANSQRRYPLADTAECVSVTGDFKLPDDFLVEVDLAVHAGNDVSPGQFFIMRIDAYTTGYAITIGYKPGGSAVAVASTLVPASLFADGSRNHVFALTGINDFADTTGKIVIGSLDGISQQPSGSWSFDFAKTQLDPDAIRPIIRGVSSITLVSGSQRSEQIYGDIDLVAGANAQFVVSYPIGQNPQIRLNFIRGEGTIKSCDCYNSGVLASPVRTINSVHASASNEFTLIASGCLSLVPITNGLKLVDTCAKPCCGATELEAITSDLIRLENQASVVSNYVSQLKVSVTTMDMVVLGSKLSDRGCGTV